MDVQADAASKAGTSPQDEKRGAFAFAGLVLDLDACTLKRESGEAIALTRGRIRPVARVCASARPGAEPRFSARRRRRPAQRSVRPQRRRDGRAPQEEGRTRPETAERYPDRSGRRLSLHRAAVASQAARRNGRRYDRPPAGGRRHPAASHEPADVARAMAGPSGRSRALPHRGGCRSPVAPDPSGKPRRGFDRRPPVREYERRQGTGLFR